MAEVASAKNRTVVRIQVPGDKSLSHRALIFGALASGDSEIRNILQSDDIRSTIEVLRSLGVSISDPGPVVRVHGVGINGLKPPVGDLYCGNSGTTARLMAGVLAAQPFRARLTGDESLSKRPMKRVSEPLSRMGARFEFENNDGCLPMSVSGPAILDPASSLHSIDWSSKTASAQVKSAILLAGLVGNVRVSITEPTLSRDHTERFLKFLNIPISAFHTGNGSAPDSDNPAENSPSVILENSAGSRVLPEFSISVPGDPSSAAFFAGLAASLSNVTIELPNVCLNPTRVGFFKVLAKMGASIVITDHVEVAGEEVGTIQVSPLGNPEGAPLQGVSIVGEEVASMVDELPLIACLAARASGVTTITGAEELRVKETDRISAVVSNLVRVGVEAEELPDGMRIVGGTQKLSGKIQTFGDHRIAMSFAILSVLSGGGIIPDDPDCVSVSYPDFWNDLSRVTSQVIINS